MELQINTSQLKLIIQQAAELGAILALTKVGLLPPYLKKSEAFRKYGRAKTENLIKDGDLTTRKDGCDSAAWRIDRLEMEALVRAAKLLRHL